MKPIPTRQARLAPLPRARVSGARMPLAALALTIAVALSGCALTPPEPWQKGDLARPEMALQAWPLQTRMQEHLYNSKENASGSARVGGGGCGCN